MNGKENWQMVIYDPRNLDKIPFAAKSLPNHCLFYGRQSYNTANHMRFSPRLETLCGESPKSHQVLLVIFLIRKCY